MSLTNLTARLSLFGTIAPPAGFGMRSGAVTVGLKESPNIGDVDSLWFARLMFSAAAQTATIDLTTGAVTFSAAGTRQTRIMRIVAASGATASGNLSVVVTSSLVSGSPRTVLVPLTTTRHTHADLIAAAIAEAINADENISSLLYTASSSGPDLTLTRKEGQANDSSLSLSITADLGVSGVKPNMVVTGTLTSDGVTPVVFPTLTVYGNYDGRPYYSGTNANLLWDSGNGRWQLILWASGLPVATFFAQDNVATPDLTASWVADNPATGTPIVTSGIAGVQGVVMDRLGGSAKDAFGLPLPVSGNVRGFALRLVSEDTPDSIVLDGACTLPDLAIDQLISFLSPSTSPTLNIASAVITAGGGVVLDAVVAAARA